MCKGENKEERSFYFMRVTEVRNSDECLRRV
jgi:hypothetical protein